MRIRPRSTFLVRKRTGIHNGPLLICSPHAPPVTSSKRNSEIYFLKLLWQSVQQKETVGLCLNSLPRLPGFQATDHKHPHHKPTRWIWTLFTVLVMQITTENWLSSLFEAPVVALQLLIVNQISFGLFYRSFVPVLDAYKRQILTWVKHNLKHNASCCATANR